MTQPDLTAEVLGELLPGRAIRVYPALLSTEAEALAWARAGAPDGAVVAAGYQVSPRGRGGIEWTIPEGEGLGFSLVLRPELPPQREGWLYVVATVALAGVLGPDAVIEWPDEVRSGADRLGADGVRAEPGLLEIEWAVLNVMVAGARPPRGPLLAEVVEAIEQTRRRESSELLEAARPRLATLGARVRAHLVPMGPAGAKVEGTARDLREDGGLAVETDRGRTVTVVPRDLGRLERL